jgi:hypothetical protein
MSETHIISEKEEFHRLVLEWGRLYSSSKDYLHDEQLAESSRALGVFCWNHEELMEIKPRPRDEG